MKARISLTLDKTLLERLDALVDHVEVRSRSHAVERMLRDHLAEEGVAVILCGGTPEQLRIPKENVLRPLIRLNKKTLIEHQLGQCREFGFRRVLIVGMRQVLARVQEVVGDGSQSGVSVEYVFEDESLGDAKTLERVADRVRSTMIVMPCDYYFTFDLRRLYSFHGKQEGVATLFVCAEQYPSANSCYVRMEGQEVVSLEFGPKASSTMVGTLVFAANPEIFSYIPRGRVHASLREHVFPKLAAERRLSGYLTPGIRVNIHTVDDVEQARKLDSTPRA